MVKRERVGFLVAALSVLAGAGVSSGGTLHVPGSYPSIQAAIDAAVAGDVVLVANGVYSGVGNTNLNPDGKAITIRSASGPDTCIIDGQLGNPGFVIFSGETDLTVIDGFKIRNCRGNGAGMYIFASDPVVRNCIIEDSVANGLDLGGGLRVSNAAPQFVNCTFRDNTSQFVGGNVFINGGSDASFERCTFERGTSFACGGVFVDESDVQFVNCLFVDNESAATETGGGLYLVEGAFALVVNCTFVGNTAPGPNSAGAILVENSTIELYNSILWANSAPALETYLSLDIVEFSLVEGDWPGTGNLDVDPMFIGLNDFHLAECSPAQNAGDESLLPPGILTDLDGASRVSGPDVDMGVFESSLPSCGGGDDPISIPGLAAGDQAGTSVANVGDVDRDGFNDFSISSPFHDGTASNAGIVEIFSGATLELLYRIDGETKGERYGWSVAGLGDINGDGASEFVVGIPYHDAAASNAGRVVVYSGINAAPIFIFNGESISDHFGESVAAGKDIDGDLVPDILVGAPFNDEGGRNAGKVYAFSGAGGHLIATSIGRQAEERFGWSIDIIGNTNGDIFADVIVGAPRNADNGTKAGKAYILGGPSLFEIRNRRGKRPGDQFGRAVLGVGEVTGDEFDDYAVTSPYYDTTNRSNTGRIYMYSGENGLGHWSAFGAESNEWFGISAARAGDINGDGASDILIGAPVRLQNARPGVIELWSGADRQLLLAYEGLQPADQYGYDLDVLGDIDDDGIVEAIVGAPTDDVAGNNSGRVEIVDLPNT